MKAFICPTQRALAHFKYCSQPRTECWRVHITHFVLNTIVWLCFDGAVNISLGKHYQIGKTFKDCGNIDLDIRAKTRTLRRQLRSKSWWRSKMWPWIGQWFLQYNTVSTSNKRCWTASEFKNSPGWYDSVDWVPACEPKGHQFDSQSGHMPGLWARSPVRGSWEATTHWCFPLFPSVKK